MGKLNQNDLEWIKDMMQQGKMTAAQANVEKVRLMRVQLVTTRLPADVRTALNSAVKDGTLSHKKKEGRKPEVYYHPQFEHLANAERNEEEMRTIQALMGVMAYAEPK